MKKFFSEQPLFILLVALFYLFSTLNAYFNLLLWSDLFIPTSLTIIGIHTALYLLFGYLWPRQRKFALLALYASVVYLFFGSILDFFKRYLPILSTYTYLLPFLLIIGAIIFWLLRRSKHPFHNLFLYLNILLVIFNINEIGKGIIVNSSTLSNRFGPNYSKDADFQSAICDTCQHPDIYMVVFDGYSASRTLKDFWGYDNSGLDSFLRQQHFFVAGHARSNYNFTPYSLGSMLNMDFHASVPNMADIPEFSEGIARMRPNKVMEVLRQNKYEIINQSFFPLSEEKPALNMTYLAGKERTILSQTLPKRTRTDIGWNFGWYKPEDEVKEEYSLAAQQREQIGQNYSAIKAISGQANQTPRFVFTHFLFPHDPYFYDSTGRLTPDSIWFKSQGSMHNYLSQLKYANTYIKDLAVRLKRDAARPRIILLISDHGYRGFRKEELRSFEFNNLFAVYFPDEEYSTLSDSVTAINTFPLLFNKYFHARIPLKKDSTVYIPH
ncbi:sulfatase-like hydrolase/transferase [Paraflavitalea sp. CAU 1676]|uniref:sulfatase-like hydrolase/transferase n=1 Tax=Paraflavitalea sp. CAU 1676 TaxID=3032598 RepID=UPI0023DA0F77|nr:sulfatase-like hydrolase/transferase [Paraflavitalea sp. CAU 1676]MDF2189518.1 sulfatase-like hydrolase/transferase [Paraflavitalea sp. CAU 1676]